VTKVSVILSPKGAKESHGEKRFPKPAFAKAMEWAGKFGMKMDVCHYNKGQNPLKPLLNFHDTSCLAVTMNSLFFFPFLIL